VVGQWSVGLTSNFMLTFAGNLKSDLVLNYKAALLRKFSSGMFNLIKNNSLKKFIVLGVPCVHHPNGSLPKTPELFMEFQ